MKNLINIILFLFLSQVFYAQEIKKYPSVIVLLNDTLVCFNTQQSKQMALWNEDRKECVELRKLDNQTIEQMQLKSNEQNNVISNLEKQVVEYKGIISDKDELLKINEDEKKQLKKEVRRQKAGKWIAIVGGVVLSVICLAI